MEYWDMRKKSSLMLAAIAALSLGLVAANGKHPHVDKYAEQVVKIGIPIQEAINKVMEEHGGIPIGASIQPHEDAGTGFVFWVETVRPAKDGMPASIWAVGVDANTGELLGTHDRTRAKDRELGRQAKERELRNRERKVHEKMMQERERKILEMERKLEKQQNQPKQPKPDAPG